MGCRYKNQEGIWRSREGICGGCRKGGGLMGVMDLGCGSHCCMRSYRYSESNGSLR